MKKTTIKKILCITFICFMIILISGNPIFAALNPDHMHKGDLSEDMGGLIVSILGIGMGALAAPLVSLAFVLLMVIFSTMYYLFAPVSGGATFPFPDQIVFNRLAFFDPNFLDPPTQGVSPVAILQDVISNMYYTFYVIANAIFLLAIMIIAIKLAVATIATDKAHYKKALTSWAFGLLIVFILPFLMAGIFKINETIVNAAYDGMKANEIKFPITGKEVSEAIVGAATLGIGTNIAKIINFFQGITNPNLDTAIWEPKGYRWYDNELHG